MQRFYRIETAHRGWLAECPTSGRVISVPAAHVGRGSNELFLFVSACRPDVCFLIARHQQRLRLHPGIDGPGAIGLGLAWDGDSRASLYEPSTGYWIRANDGDVIVDRNVTGFAELFRFHEIANIFLPQEVIEKATCIEKMVAMPLDAEHLATDAASFEIVASLLSSDRLKTLAVTLAASSSASLALSRLFPEDLMGRHGLVGLAEWQARRDQARADDAKPAGPGWFGRSGRLFGRAGSESLGSTLPTTIDTPRIISRALDSLANLGQDGFGTTLLHKLNALARSAVTPRKEVCVIATARNEGLYLLEWVAYYRALGVDRVFLYTNDSDDGSEQLLQALHKADAVDWIKNEIAPGGYAQLKSYGHALGVNPDVLDYRWALFVDLDEYFMFNPNLFQSMRQFLRWHEARGSDAVALNWVMFGPSGQSHWKDDFIARRFPFVSGLDHHIKTICQPRQFIHSTPHHPVTCNDTAFTFNDAAGQPHRAHPDLGLSLSADPSCTVAWINHYFFKSGEEFLLKWSRNRGDGPTTALPSKTVIESRFIEMFMRNYHTTDRPTVTPEQCAPRFQEELSQLTALAGVRDSLKAIQQLFRDRMKVIAPLFVDAPGVRDAGQSGVDFLALVDPVPGDPPVR